MTLSQSFMCFFVVVVSCLIFVVVLSSPYNFLSPLTASIISCRLGAQEITIFGCGVDFSEGSVVDGSVVAGPFFFGRTFSFSFFFWRFFSSVVFFFFQVFVFTYLLTQTFEKKRYVSHSRQKNNNQQRDGKKQKKQKKNYLRIYDFFGWHCFFCRRDMIRLMIPVLYLQKR